MAYTPVAIEHGGRVLLIWGAGMAWAGLGPANTVVLYNDASGAAADVAAYYAEQRQLPPGHTCGVTGVDPETRTTDLAGFEAIRDALEACIAALPQPDEIDVIVTVRGLPYVVELPQRAVGFEAALQVGRGTTPGGEEVLGQPNAQNATVPNPTYVGGRPCLAADLTESNAAGGWYRSSCTLTREKRLPRSFARVRTHELDGYDFTDQLFIVSRLDGFDFDDARALVDRGVAADGAFPGGEFLCMKGADPARSARDPECEYTVRRLAEIGANATWLPAFDGALTGREVVTLFTGAASFRDGIAGQTYAPGALACNLTSFGAVPTNFFCNEDGSVCPASESQTSIARFVRAGASAAHGTVAEPLNNSFPDASTLLLYHEGYSLGESMLYSLEFLYWYNLLLGDPLATPFAERPTVELPTQVEVGGPVTVTAAHPDGVKQIVLYDGGVRVAEADGAELTWVPEAVPGAVLDLFAVATADAVLVGRPSYDASVSPPTGWEQPDEEGQRVRPDTQGWASASVEVVAVPDPEPDSKGCQSAAGFSWPLGGLAAMMLLLTAMIQRQFEPSRSHKP